MFDLLNIDFIIKYFLYLLFLLFFSMVLFIRSKPFIVKIITLLIFLIFFIFVVFFYLVEGFNKISLAYFFISYTICYSYYFPFFKQIFIIICCIFLDKYRVLQSFCTFNVNICSKLLRLNKKFDLFLSENFPFMVFSFFFTLIADFFKDFLFDFDISWPFLLFFSLIGFLSRFFLLYQVKLFLYIFSRLLKFFNFVRFFLTSLSLLYLIYLFIYFFFDLF